nr:xylulose kinase-1 [Tanacetum cinerariifolium]
MVVFLEKPTECKGFELIVDFLSVHTLRYALTVNPTIYDSCIEQFWSTSMTKTINGESQIHVRVDGKEIIITKSSVRSDLRLADKEGVDCLPNFTNFKNLKLMEHVAYEAVYKELDDRLVRVATTASSLEAEQDSGNIDKTESKETPNEASSLRTTLGGGLRTKTTQALKITSLKRRVKKLEKKQRSRTHKLKRLYKIGLITRVDSFKDDQSLSEDASKQRKKIHDIDADEDITLLNDQDDADMFDVNDLHGEEVFVKEVDDKEVNDEVQKVVEEVVKDINIAKLIINVEQVSTIGEVNTASITINLSAAAIITTDEITLAQALMEIKTSKPKAKGIVLQELSESTTTTIKTISLKKSQDKSKAIMIKEHVKPKKKDQIMLDKEAALKLQAEFDEEEQRLARENAQKEQEANITLIEEWNDIQVKIDANYQLAQRLQVEEQQELSDAKKATLFMQFLEKRRKFFTAKAAEEKRNNPSTQAQQRKIMCTYLKNVEGKKLKDLKNKSFDSIQKMFNRVFNRVNTFVDFKTKLVEGSSKRAG